MPYLQLDVPGWHPVETKRELARNIGDIFADIMETTPEQVTVAIREFDDGSIWRCGHGEPEPAALLMCDIRRGRPAEQRARLAEALVETCVQSLGLRADRLSVEFTQHAGDEMYKAERGGFNKDWSSDEKPASRN
jgi:phenylpyruvate tautomerase PptA (4-oxalocrotonate tautomerase family)